MATLTAFLVITNVVLLLIVALVLFRSWRRDRLLTAAVARVVAEIDAATAEQRELRSRYVAMFAELPRLEREIAAVCGLVTKTLDHVKALTGGARETPSPQRSEDTT